MRFAKTIRQTARELFQKGEITFAERLKLTLASNTPRGREQIALAMGEYVESHPEAPGLKSIPTLPVVRDPSDWLNWFQEWWESIDWEQVLAFCLVVVKIILPIILLFI